MDKKQPKLLYIINHMDWFWSHRLPLAQGAKNQGWNVEVAATGADTDTKLNEIGMQGLALPASDQGPTPIAVLKIIKAIRQHIKTQKPDLLHTITLKYCFFSGIAALGTKTKLVHTIAGLGYLFSSEGLKPKLLRFAIAPLLKLALKGKQTQIIFQNPDDLEIMTKNGFVRKENCHLIKGSGVDIEQFKPATNVKKSNTTPRIVMPTRLVHDKGVAIFIEAARILKNKGIEASFEIAGGITTHNPLAISKEEMEEMTKDGAAKWLGKVSDMPALLQDATMIVYPSYYREGVPKVLLEAAACGKAIVTTDHPGCRETVTEGKNGYLVPIKDAAATAEAIEKILKDDKLREKMEKNSRILAKNTFDVKIIVEKTIKVYNQDI